MHLKGNNLKKISLGETSEERGLIRNVHKIQGINYVSEIDLQGTQLFCNCKVLDFVEFLSKWIRSVFPDAFVEIYYNNLTCSGPPELMNRSLMPNQWWLNKFVTAQELYCEEKCIKNCVCLDYPHEKILKINCTYKRLEHLDSEFLRYIDNQKNRNIELYLSDNMFTETPNLSKCSGNITVLDLSYNKISKVTKDVLSDNLQELKLHNNSLSTLDDEVLSKLSQLTNNTLQKLTLHSNPWICECKIKILVQFLRNFQKNIDPDHKVMCYGDQGEVSLQNEFVLCYLFYLIITVFISTFGTILGIFAAFYYKYKKEIKIWLYSRQWCLWFVTEDELDEDKEYDAFISYSHKDEVFVKGEIADQLENGPQSYKLCLHDRDWLAG